MRKRWDRCKKVVKYDTKEKLPERGEKKIEAISIDNQIKYQLSK